MQFRTFRTLKGWTLAQAADVMRLPDDKHLAGINAAMISRHERGIAFPAPELVARYEKISEGAVTYSDWSALRSSVKDHGEALS